jgi:hypothetical protein
MISPSQNLADLGAAKGATAVDAFIAERLAAVRRLGLR